MRLRIALNRLALALLACLIVQANVRAQDQITFTQITFGSGCGSSYPSLSASGDKLAFESFCDLVPGSNPNGITQVFLIDSNGTGITQLTHGSNHSSNAGLDANGDKVVFISFADLVPGQNTDGNTEIFVINSDGTGLTQLTHTVGGVFVGAGDLANFLPAFNYPGRRIVFASDLDLTASGHTDNQPEIYEMNSEGTGKVQVTETPGGADSSSPAAEPSGRRVFFISNGDWVGNNPQFVAQLFSINLDQTGVRQLTDAPPPGLNLNERTGIDAAGRSVVFTSNADLVAGSNTDGNSEVFLLDTTTGLITQITNTVGGRGCFAPAISASGRMVAFSCDRDLVGLNPGLFTQVFLAKLP